MSIISLTPIARFFKIAKAHDTNQIHIPLSAQRKLKKQYQMRPFNINRDVQGSRPWHSYVAKVSNQKT